MRINSNCGNSVLGESSSRRIQSSRGVLTRKSIYEEIAEIIAPTLVMVGDMDLATVPAKAERIHQQIKGSQLLTIPGAGHSSSIEAPDL